MKWPPLRSSHIQRKNYFCFRDSGASADAPLSHFHGRGRKGKRPRPLSQSLTALPALPKGEPLAWRYSFRLNCKVCGFARASPFGRGGIASAMTERASPLPGRDTPSVLSLRVKPPSPRGRLQAVPQSFWFRQRLPPRGSCQSRQALTEGVKLPLRGQISPGRGKMSPQVTKGGIWHRAAMTERVKASPWGSWRAQRA